jgi:hypothetical protein
MNQEPLRKSPSVAWTLSILAAPALYLLSVPVVWRLSISAECGMPVWTLRYVEPYRWIERETAAGPYLTAYAKWWSRILRGSR